jgi:hypothetical protein
MRALLAAVGLLAALVPATGCRRMLGLETHVDPDATFAAHRSGSDLIVDRLGAGKSGVLRPAGILRLPGSPGWVLSSGGEPRAWLWLEDPSHVVVRGGPTGRAPRLGEVRPSWDDGAIRLTLAPADGPAATTDVFAREGGGTGPAVLSRRATLSVDLRGTYRATVRDPAGAPVGWLRVQMTRNGPVAAGYDAVLPPACGGALAAAAAAALDDEIASIERQALDVHRGS